MARSQRRTSEQTTLDLLQGRELREIRAHIESEAKKRSEFLTKRLRTYLKYPAVFDSVEARDRNDRPQRSLGQAGAARQRGLELAHNSGYRLKIQENIGVGADGNTEIAGYSYQFYGPDGESLIFRFEYHPGLGQKDSWSSKHHLHVESLTVPDGRLGRIHFPVAEFLPEPIEPENVLWRVLDWSKQELTRS